jgi:hypothetical protein
MRSLLESYDPFLTLWRSTHDLLQCNLRILYNGISAKRNVFTKCEALSKAVGVGAGLCIKRIIHAERWAVLRMASVVWGVNSQYQVRKVVMNNWVHVFDRWSGFDRYSISTPVSLARCKSHVYTIERAVTSQTHADRQTDTHTHTPSKAGHFLTKSVFLTNLPKKKKKKKNLKPLSSTTED